MAWEPIKPRYVSRGRPGVTVTSQYAYVTGKAVEQMLDRHPGADFIACFFDRQSRQVAFVLGKGPLRDDVLCLKLGKGRDKYSKNLRHAMLKIGFTEGFYPLHKFAGEIGGKKIHYLINSPKGAKETIK